MERQNKTGLNIGATSGSWLMRFLLAAFGLPFLSVGFFISFFGVMAIVSGNSFVGGVIGFLFGLPFLAFGAVLLIGAVQGPSTVAKRLGSGRARAKLEAIQARMEEAAEEAADEAGRRRAANGDGDEPGGPDREIPTLAVLNQALNSTRYSRCPECDSPITDASLISPSGDVRCEFCRTWFNARKD